MKKVWWIVLLLTACATTGRGAYGDHYWLKPADTYIGMDDAVSLLHYANYVRGLSIGERERELERQRTAYARDKSDFRRLQYAFALSAGEAGPNERKLALQLLEAFQDGRHDSGLAALAAVLATHLNSVAQAQQMGAQQGQKRIDELEKKLDAVKDIERSLLRREKGKL